MDRLPRKRRSMTLEERIDYLEFRMGCVEKSLSTDSSNGIKFTIKCTPSWNSEAFHTIGIFNTMEDAQKHIPKCGFTRHKDTVWTYTVVECE